MYPGPDFLNETVESKSMSGQIELPCPKCRSTKMKWTSPELRDGDRITCADCGFELGTMASIRQKMGRAFERMRQAEKGGKLQ